MRGGWIMTREGVGFTTKKTKGTKGHEEYFTTEARRHGGRTENFGFQISEFKFQSSTVRFKSECVMKSPVLPMVLGVY